MMGGPGHGIGGPSCGLQSRAEFVKLPAGFLLKPFEVGGQSADFNKSPFGFPSGLFDLDQGHAQKGYGGDGRDRQNDEQYLFQGQHHLVFTI